MAGVLTKLQNLVGGYDWEDVKQFCLNNVRTALVFGVGVTAFWLMFRKPRGIPPGPKLTLPIIGDLLYLGKDPDVRIGMRKLRRAYGDIFSLYMGQRLVVCLNGYRLIKEALVRNSEDFSDRPTMYMNNILFDQKGVIFSSGPVWKEQRKFSVETLREFGFGKSIMEDKIVEEIEVFVSVLAEKQNKPFDLSPLTQAAVFNVLSSMVYGQRFEYDNPKFVEFLELSDQNFKAVGAGAILNFIPGLRFLPGDLFTSKRTRRNTETIEKNIIIPSIKEHERHFDENDVRDFISSYLKEANKVQKEGVNSNIRRENLPMLVRDLFLAGTESNAATLSWAILYFLHYPEIQNKCYKEIQDVVGSGRLPSLKDRDSMKYVQAFWMELLRSVNIGILGGAYGILRDTKFKEYVFPKDTIILPNLDSVLADEDIWGDPDIFRPERFLDADNQIIKKEEFIPFSIGKRKCPGDVFSKMEFFLFFTTLVQRFEFSPVDPSNLPSLKGHFGITHAPCKYEVIIRQRSTVNL